MLQPGEAEPFLSLPPAAEGDSVTVVVSVVMVNVGTTLGTPLYGWATVVPWAAAAEGAIVTIEPADGADAPKIELETPGADVGCVG